MIFKVEFCFRHTQLFRVESKSILQCQFLKIDVDKFFQGSVDNKHNISEIQVTTFIFHVPNDTNSIPELRSIDTIFRVEALYHETSSLSLWG